MGEVIAYVVGILLVLGLVIGFLTDRICHYFEKKDEESDR